MPFGVFKPYAGVSTAVLLFTRGGTTDKIWFYDMEHDGFSLDDTALCAQVFTRYPVEGSLIILIN